MEKKRVAILFGGKSAEHEVSLESALNIIKAINKDKYELILIGINHKGDWFLYNSNFDFNNFKLRDPDNKIDYFEKLAVIPGNNKNQLYNLSKDEKVEEVDVFFPVLHGPFGEDGTIQGLLKTIDTPFVGAGVLSSALAMDKDFMKRLLRDKGINIADYKALRKYEELDIEKVIDELGLPLFVKPANLGSSVGVNKVEKKESLIKAVNCAFKYDNKIIIEEYIAGREIECSVLGNVNYKASLAGEIEPQSDFYSYDAKYIDDKGAKLSIPAKLSDKIINKVKDISIKVCDILEVEDMARVDSFLTADDEIIINEINTIPGFTNISMYPKLWEISGLNNENLVDKLIELAIKRYIRDKNLKTKLN